MYETLIWISYAAADEIFIDEVELNVKINGEIVATNWQLISRGLALITFNQRHELYNIHKLLI